MPKQFIIILTITGGALVLYGALFGSVVASGQPLNHPVSHWPIFPIACTTRGCITSASWAAQHRITQAFNESVQAAAPTPEQTLTSIIRKHVVEHASLRSPVSPEDVVRYREDILHATIDQNIQQYLPITTAEYDELILTPFLQQEALRHQHKVESTQELYKILAEERTIFLLLFDYRWNTGTGAAEST